MYVTPLVGGVIVLDVGQIFLHLNGAQPKHYVAADFCSACFVVTVPPLGPELSTQGLRVFEGSDAAWSLLDSS